MYYGTHEIKKVYVNGHQGKKLYLGDKLLWKDVIKMSVTCDFDNVTSNAPSQANYEEPLVVVLSGVGSNKVQANSVVVMMGETDITSTAYNHATKTITIASVTDNVSITAIGRPYDAEVEWLLSDGVAYIDTGFKHNQNTRFVCKLDFGSSVAAWSYPFGSFGGTSGSNKLFCVGVNSNLKITSYFGSSTSHAFSISAAGIHTFDLNKRSHKVDDTTYSFSSRTFSSSYNTIIYGVTAYDGGITHSNTPPKLMYFKIYDNGNLVRDFVPVKDGGIGYLYDNVSGTLYGNAGSGAFTYGNDKV